MTRRGGDDGPSGRLGLPGADLLEGKTFVGGALLSLVAYVLYDALKALTDSVAARDREPDAVARAPIRAFETEVVEAFRAGKVDICVMGYTGETLLHEIEQGLRALGTEAEPGDEVRIRILAPDFSKPRQIPSRIENGTLVDDVAFRGTITRKCQSVDTQLEGSVEGLSPGVRAARTVSCAYRVYDGIPDIKLVILNEELVLYGFYDLKTVRSWPGGLYRDPSGADTALTKVTVGERGAVARAAVKEWRKLFDGRWETAAAPSWRGAGPPGPA